MPIEDKTLTIVVPALDEEEAIGQTVERCLAARSEICERTGLERVEVIVVSDGSTDGTERIALGYEEATVVVFEKNRGYGAAIQCGFEQGSGAYVSFLDADGTCDPRMFSDLYLALKENGAAVALGSRMGPESEMPRIRTLGNRLFALMLGVLAKQVVGDTASGMRVIRRDALADLYPLPDGLHFTPAMSARVLLEDKLRLVEVPMPYAEREGVSKLSVLRDGVRFFTTIAQAAMCYRPARPLLLVAAALLLASAAISWTPLSFYADHRRLEEWMIYRVLLSSLLATGAALAVCGAVVAERIAALATGRVPASSGVTGWVTRFFSKRMRLLGGSILVVVATALVWPGLTQYALSGTVDLHWSRIVLSALLLVVAMVLGVTTFLLNMSDLLHARLRPQALALPPDRVRRAAAA